MPGKCFFTVEFRHPDTDVLAQMDAALCAQLAAVAAGTGLVHSIEQIFAYPPVPFAPACIEAVRAAAKGLGYAHADIISGAGHDACHLARIASTRMIFVPCVDGLSHNEAEAITPEWAQAGANVLLHAVLASSGGAVLSR